MSVPVHVRIGVSGSGAHQVESVLPAEVEEYRLQNEDTDHNAVTDKFVRDHGLDEKRQHGESHDLREGDKVQLLEVLKEFVMIVAGDGLHHDADQHGNGKQNEFNESNGRELG